jgi:phosphatidylethanolamine-binding protein (PEBP) family uncharacterized protein
MQPGDRYAVASISPHPAEAVGFRLESPAFALILDDPDAPPGLRIHRVLVDIPAAEVRAAMAGHVLAETRLTGLDARPAA